VRQGKNQEEVQCQESRLRPEGKVMSVKRVLTALPASAVLLVSATALTPAVSAAVEAKPFGVTQFSVQATRATRIGEFKGAFGNEMEIVNEPYVPAFTQAGGHPWGLTTTIEFANEPRGRGTSPTREPKDIVVGIPPGFLGDPLAVPRCSLTVAVTLGNCPAATQVGFYRLKWLGGKQYLGPIVDVVPEHGQSAEFALENDAHVSAVLTGHLVHTPEGYRLTVSSSGIPRVELYRTELTFWGVPADPSHDAMRGLECASLGPSGSPFACDEPGATGGLSSGVTPVPFLTLSTDCAAGPERATLRTDSWEEPGSVREQVYQGFAEATAAMPAVTGCDQLAFDPSIEVRPNTELADEPVGLGVSLKVPLTEAPEANATPQLRNALVTLPEGVSVNPGSVDGIQACDARGPDGINITGPESERVSASGELQLAPGHCPSASIVGEAEAITPLLGEPLKGRVFLARPQCGGAGEAACTEHDALDGSLYKLYLELGGEGELATTGVHVKVAGRTEANPATGQLTTVFEENPQVPFSELKIRLNGGPRAPLANPAGCGPAVTSADFTPWSAPGLTPAPESLLVSGTPDATPFSPPFNVVGCSSPPGLAPGFSAGTVTPQAGQFSAFTMNVSRKDREQYVKGVQIHTPPGLLAMLSSVPLCPEAQANDPALYGECTASKIGTTRVASGAGSHPFEIEGNVYLTGSHDGAPFGLSVVTHAVAGPFNLGLVVVRARIEIDPTDSTATITTDETGPYSLPQIIFGVPLRLKQITVNIDRPGFMFNPTNCKGQQITARISGNQNAAAGVSSPFAAGGCKSLAFQPRFTASTSGHTSRANGASLDAKVTYPLFRAGSQANISYVKVELPKQLPSRLTTLQKACTDSVFNSNPAACPSASIIGIARTSTPLLPAPPGRDTNNLTGPVYFVSHGGEAFPSLIVVLQGDGVRVDLTGTTFISKAGITSSTFKTVPDVPVNTFEIYLPEGRFSALAANGNLCKEASKLKMPTELVAQNGAVLKQATPVAITGCPKAKMTKKKTKKRTKKGRGKAKKSSRGSI
jgi:hypothetical protein